MNFLKIFKKKNRAPGIHKLLNKCSPDQEIDIISYMSIKDIIQSYYSNVGVHLYKGKFCRIDKQVYKNLKKYRIVKIQAVDNILHIGVIVK